jgi:hypothetical protein
MVYVILNHDGSPWRSKNGKTQAFKTLPEAEWQAWSISHRKVMIGGVGFGKKTQPDPSDPKKTVWVDVPVVITRVLVDSTNEDQIEIHPGIDLAINQIDKKKPGNFTVA